MTRKIGLDVVRAAAIGLVLASHFLKSLNSAGVYGVELFFGLSGFLIGGILYRRLSACSRWSFGEVKVFWFRRWWRTLPNYYLFLTIWLVYHFCFGGLPTIVGFCPFLIFCQDLFSVKSPFFSVSWSLCVEEWFYFLFPLTILFFTSLRLSNRLAFLVTTLLFLLVPFILRERMFAQNDPETIRETTIPRLDAIFYGVATSFVFIRYKVSPSLKLALFLVALIGIVVLLVYQHQCESANSLIAFYRAAFVFLPLCFSLMLPFLASIEHLPFGCGFLAQPVKNLSLWSYSVYLSHIPILWFVYAVFAGAREHLFVDLLSKIVGLGTCLCVSKLVYDKFETRLMLLRPDEQCPPEGAIGLKADLGRKVKSSI
jgi:peptidoglycan/LPS O-acetylase OafA/YrhL